VTDRIDLLAIEDSVGVVAAWNVAGIPATLLRWVRLPRAVILDLRIEDDGRTIQHIRTTRIDETIALDGLAALTRTRS
jgi:hypothetical protein